MVFGHLFVDVLSTHCIIVYDCSALGRQSADAAVASMSFGARSSLNMKRCPWQNHEGRRVLRVVSQHAGTQALGTEQPLRAAFSPCVQAQGGQGSAWWLEKCSLDVCGVVRIKLDWMVLVVFSNIQTSRWKSKILAPPRRK